jgi:ABC-type sugar transport system ATPase subunit
MISWMVGREVENFYTRHPGKPGPVVLEVDGLTLPSLEGGSPLVDGVHLELQAGEILGIAGLMGAGNSELLCAIFGRYGRRARGSIRINGRPVNIRHPLEAIRKGLCLLTNDRKASGLVMPLSVARNMTLASLPEVSKFGWLMEAREQTLARHYQDTLDIRVPSLDSEVYTLSGGNQQKVILAKWMMTNPSVILLDEPTRGIDVGAKAEIYRLMDAWTARGKAILLITSELPELLAMSDRILVMRRGCVSAEFNREEADPQKVMAAAV